jgi:antitoxin VapB
MITAKVFKSGNSQAVRLPKEYRLDAKEVSVNRIGNVLMLVPMGDPWRVFSEGLKEIGNDLPRVIPKLKNSTRIGFK